VCEKGGLGVRKSARAQLLHGLVPVFLRRAFWTAASYPELVRESGDIVVSEGGDSMSNCRLVSMPARILFMLEFLLGTLASGRVVLFSVQFAHFVRMRGDVT
jgi:hypothetical protein